MGDSKEAFIFICCLIAIVGGMILISWDLGWKAAVGITLISAVSSVRTEKSG